ncbi:hypothetical protein FRUB_03863 [Fimbriiglobus ruber]|uniref:Uncharacterized protein n=1 Tax=Fimbriiglobus ruber TaxID=1908690 RepID=A0A225DZJ4_9BACT|nr:hypothetical protein FRUB_03863 [Fimbriiglobus ruber]
MVGRGCGLGFERRDDIGQRGGGGCDRNFNGRGHQGRNRSTPPARAGSDSAW